MNERQTKLPKWNLVKDSQNISMLSSANIDFHLSKTYYNPIESIVLYSMNLLSITSSAELVSTYPTKNNTRLLNNLYDIQREDSGQYPGLGDSYDGLVTDLRQIIRSSYGVVLSLFSVAIHLFNNSRSLTKTVVSSFSRFFLTPARTDVQSGGEGKEKNWKRTDFTQDFSVNYNKYITAEL